MVTRESNKNKKKKKDALLVVDMTNDFLMKSYNPNLALEKGLELVPRIRSLEERPS